MTSMYPSWVDEHLPPRGPCAFCGSADARHRVIAAVVGAVKAGDTPEMVAADYELPVEFVRRLVAVTGREASRA